MQFVSIYTNQTINTDDFLACFVDEYTGEVKEDRRVLDKRVRKLWFRSSMPKAVIHTDVKVSCQQTNAESASVPSALAYVQILDENGGVLAENWSQRQAVSIEGEKPFAYYTRRNVQFVAAAAGDCRYRADDRRRKRQRKSAVGAFLRQNNACR